MIWDRQPDEPNNWYARFDVYLNLRTQRTIEEAYRACAFLEGLKSERPGAQWYQIAKEWEWESRADAFDAAERERLRSIDADRRFDAREQRLHMIEQLLSAVFGVLMTMNIFTSPKDTSDEWLPTLRVMFKDLLTAQRIDLGLPVDTPDQLIDLTPFTADEFAEAQRQLTVFTNGEPKPRKPRPQATLTRLRNILAKLYPNQASTRRIARDAGLNPQHLDLDGSPIDNWQHVIDQANHSNDLETLIAVVQSEYYDNQELAETLGEFH